MEEEKTERKKSGRRISTLGAKKKLASKMSESKLGRSTVVKLMGTDGDAIVTALKNAVTLVDDKATAKELKKDLMKWVVKAGMLVQHKELTRAEAKPLMRPALICAERLVETCDRAPPGRRDLSRVAEELRALGPLLRTLLAPHAQDKNVDKVERLVHYYSQQSFLNRLFNEDELQADANAILESTRAILVPLPSALNDVESINAAAARVRAIRAELGNPPFSMCFDKAHPEFSILFAAYLDSRPDPRLGVALRFLLAEQEYAQISNASIRASRARIVCNKYLQAQNASAASEPRLPVDGAVLDRIAEDADEQRASRAVFGELRAQYEAELQDHYAMFQSSGRFLNYKQNLRRELEELLELYGDKLELGRAPAASTSGSSSDSSASVLSMTSSAASVL